MTLGIQNITNVDVTNLTRLANVSSYPEFAINVNRIVWGGWGYFLILIVIWWIIYIALQQTRNLPMKNLMYSGTIVSIVSLLLRGVYVVQSGIVVGLLTDFQMWVFPLITIGLAVLIKAVDEG